MKNLVIKDMGYKLQGMGAGFIIGWSVSKMYPSFHPLIIFIPLVLIGMILSW